MEEENIATRLKLFFEFQGLSNSQFADSCGIPRPTLSQIITGRNKKISDKLVGQIHAAYPSLSVMWLLFGEGEMMVQDATMHDVQGESDASEVNLPSESIASVENVKETAVNSASNSRIYPINQGVRPVDQQAALRLKIAETPPVTKKISHITVYYDDSTFETFYPRK